MLYNHRLKTPLEKGMDQGKRFFFLYGDGIKDCYLEGLYEGVYTLSETLQHYFLQKEDCQYFAVANTDGVHIYEMQGHSIADISESFLAPPKAEDDMPDDEEEGVSENDPPRKESEESQKLQESIQNSGVNITNYINIIKSRAMENQDAKKRIAIFFEDFEWLAKLYSSNNDATLEYIKILKDFKKIDNCYTLTSLEDMELLKKYNFEEKGSNVLFLGNPSAKEVKYAFLRRFLRNTTFQEDVQDNLFEELEEVAQAMSSSKKSLREALQVFDTLIIDCNKESVDRTDFEIAIEKITAEKVALDDVIIEETEKQKILNAVDAFMDNDDSREYRKGFILTGPPGTGKTHIVRAISNERNCYFMAPTLSDLKGEYIGHTSGKVKRVFDEARANAPTILFIDEADTVFPSRELGSGSDSFNLDMVNQFLQEIDGMTSGKSKIFVIAATNRPNIIDAAIQSRLTERIPINLPSAENRIRIFDSKLKKYDFSIGDKPYRSEIEAKTVNMSGRDIENFVKKLKEEIINTPFRKISNLRDDEESKNILFGILESNERILIEDLQRSVPVEVTEPVNITTRYRDIIGYERIKHQISRQGEFIRSRADEKLQAKKFGIKVNKGVLLYGPPGNAKTKLAEATAKENNFYFVKVLSKDFASDSIARQLDNLQMIFDQTIRLSKMCSKYDGVLLFFDEFDSLAGIACLSHLIRGTLLDYLASGENEDSMGIRSHQSRILLMAATNFYNALDKAVIRKGRIDEHLLMENPTEEAGMQMLARIFEEDQKISLPDEWLITYIYGNLLDETKNKVQGKDEEETEALRLNARPSGAEILNLFHEIKAEAYYEQRDQLEKEGILHVNRELVDWHFRMRESTF